MGYFLGIDVGAARTLAAVARPGSDAVETVDLDGDGQPGVASVLHLGTDGALAVGAEAERWALAEPDGVVRGFPGRIGDAEPILLAGEPWAAEELTAWLVRWVVDRVAEREGGPADAVALDRPASWDAEHARLLANAVAEQDLHVTYVDAPGSAEGPDGPATRAAAAARALRDGAVAVPVRSVDGGGSGRHLAVPAGPLDGGGSGRHLTAPAAPLDGGGSGRHLSTPAAPLDGGGSGRHLTTPAAPLDGGGSGRHLAAAVGADDPDPAEPPSDGTDRTDRTDDERGTPAEPAAEGGPAVPAPRTADGSPPAEPATAHLIADLVGFTGGMGATNTAGLLSGYTPAVGLPASWSGGASAGTTTATEGDAEAGPVDLPVQRAGSGRWTAVPAGAADVEPPAPAPVRARENPTVLVSAGGAAAALAVVATLFLWPAPRTTNSATVRSAPAVPAVVAPVDPVTASVTPTPEPTAEPTRRARPAPPRTRRPVPPPVVTQTAPPTETTTAPPATASTQPDASSSAPASEGTVPPSTDPEKD